MILVTGATGTIGKHVVRLLTDNGHAARAMTRSRAGIHPSPGVEVVQADFDHAASLQQAVAGVHAVFLLTAAQVPTPRHDLALLAAARSAGVGSVVKLSAIGTGEPFGADTTVGAWHLLAEQAVRDSGMAWTVLKPSSFASNWLHWADAIAAGSPVQNLTGIGAQGIIDPRDVAAVAVAALTSPGHDSKTYTLTGPELLNVPEQASQLARILERPITTIDVPLETARQQMLASGMQPAAVDATITGSAWARAGHNAVLTDDVTRILRRPATSFRIWAQQHREAFIRAH